MAIPRVRVRAETRLPPYKMVPKATPTASPSGILCKVIDVIKSKQRFQEKSFFGRLEKQRLQKKIKTPPNKKPNKILKKRL